MPLLDDGYREVIGSVRPLEIDTSSATRVLERKDIEPYEEKDEQQNVIFKGYKYKERAIPKDQWVVETTAKNKISLEAALEGMADTYLLLLEMKGEV